MSRRKDKIDLGVALIVVGAACVGFLAFIGAMDVTAFAYKHTFENIHISN